MPQEELLDTSQNAIFMLIIVLIAAIIIISALTALGVFKEKQIQFAINIIPPEISCSGLQLTASVQHISINAQPYDMVVMPIMIYNNKIGYNADNAIALENGKGETSEILSFTLALDSQPPTGKKLSMIVTFWKWTPGGCLANAVENNPSIDYGGIVRQCSEDFIIPEYVMSDNMC